TGTPTACASARRCPGGRRWGSTFTARPESPGPTDSGPGPLRCARVLRTLWAERTLSATSTSEIDTMKALDWIVRIVAAVILLQTLFFKFTGAPESIFIFDKVGVEPWGRYLTAIAELAAA